MAQLNINTCTTRQLTNLQGIDRSLAEAIIELRYRNNGIQRMDDLLALPGMTRTKYQILCRRFCLAARPLMLGFTKGRTFSEMPASSTEFLCQGQSVGCKMEDQPEKLGPSWRLEGGSPIEQEQQEHLSLPAFKDKNNDKLQSAPGSGHTIPHKECSKKSQFKKSSPHTTLSNQTQPKSNSRPHRNKIAWSNDAKNTFPHLSRNMFTDAEPAVTLRATTSGDNINFSCTIDKRLLANPLPPYPIASQEWTLANQTYDMAITKVNTEKTIVVNKTKGKCCPHSEGGGSSKSSLSEEDHGPGKAAPVAKAADMCSPSVSTAMASTKATSSSGPEQCTMSTENLLLYDRRNRMTVRERRVYINHWLNHVHETFFDKMRNCTGNFSHENNMQKPNTKPRRQNTPLKIGPGPGFKHKTKFNYVHPQKSAEFKGHRLRNNQTCQLAGRTTKSATAPDNNDVGTNAHTDPLSVLHTRAVKSGLPPTNRLQRHDAQCVVGSGTAKMKHLINNYMTPRPKINNNVSVGFRNKLEHGRYAKQR